jgi:hypothetical protein
VFSFLNGRWRLTDFEWKYRRWAEAVGDKDLAKLVLQVALDLADSPAWRTLCHPGRCKLGGKPGLAR